MPSLIRSPNPDVLNAFWREACNALGIDQSCSFDHFHFDDSKEMANVLADEVIHGSKRATAGLLAEMELAGETIPKAGDYWIVVDGDGKPRALIQSKEVQIAPFRSVDEAFAWDEGEGDRSLAFWRSAHIDYFGRSCERLGLTWSETLDVVFERFEVLWPLSAAERPITRRPYTDAEWDAYHELRQTALFARYLPEIIYDPDYPENWTDDVFHLGMFSSGRLLGCLQVKLISSSEASFHLVAMAENSRGKGLGRRLLGDGETFASSNGRKLVRVFAEPEAEGFYRNLGFEEGPDWQATPANPAAKPLKKRIMPKKV